MSPGKFSRKPTVPNKPPVCHKSPIAALPPGLPYWKRNANLFFKWQGDATTGFAYRSWALTLKPTPNAGEQLAQDRTGDIKIEFRIVHDPASNLYNYVVNVWRTSPDYLSQYETALPKQADDPWDTGLHVVPPNLATVEATFQAMA